jgi:hypothetical protein
MALKPPVSEKQPFVVSYHAKDTSAGATLVIVGWVPKHEHRVPGSQEIIVAPGMTGTIDGLVPADAEARRMEIRVDLPDGTGLGVLKLSVNGTIVAQDVLTEDAIWTSIVV